MSWLAIFAFAAVIIGLRLLVARLGYSGIAWGGKDTPHPGWWLTRSDTVYVRRVGTRASQVQS